MSTGGWELEMNRLMETFERESTLSLRKISGCFVAINRPFNEDFHQYLLKVSNLRLGISFNRILFERLNADQVQVPSTASANVPTNDNGIASSNAKIPISNNDVSLNVPAILSTPAALKTRSKVGDASIEVLDSNEGHSGTQAFSKGLMELVASRYPNNGDQMNDKNVVAVEVKYEPELEIRDVPLIVFDPVKENAILSNEDCVCVSESMNQSQTNASSSVQKRAKQSYGRSFKCNKRNKRFRKDGVSLTASQPATSTPMAKDKPPPPAVTAAAVIDLTQIQTVPAVISTKTTATTASIPPKPAISTATLRSTAIQPVTPTNATNTTNPKSKERPSGSKSQTSNAAENNVALQQQQQKMAAFVRTATTLDPNVRSLIIVLLAEPTFMKTLATMPDQNSRTTYLREYFTLCKYSNKQQLIDGFNAVYTASQTQCSSKQMPKKKPFTVTTATTSATVTATTTATPTPKPNQASSTSAGEKPAKKAITYLRKSQSPKPTEVNKKSSNAIVIFGTSTPRPSKAPKMNTSVCGNSSIVSQQLNATMPASTSATNRNNFSFNSKRVWYEDVELTISNPKRTKMNESATATASKQSQLQSHEAISGRDQREKIGAITRAANSKLKNF